MATRALVVVVVDNQRRIANFCSDFGGLDNCGVGILEFLKTHDLDKFKQQCLKTAYLADVEVEIMKGLETARTTPEMKTDVDTMYPYFSHKLSSKILDYVYDSTDEVIKLENYSWIVNDPATRYIYVIDLDKNIFRVDIDKSPVKTFDISNLPTNKEFLKIDIKGE